MAYSARCGRLRSDECELPHARLRLPGRPLRHRIRRVVQTGITPIIDTAIAHKNRDIPSSGPGLVRARSNASKSPCRVQPQYGRGKREMKKVFFSRIFE